MRECFPQFFAAVKSQIFAKFLEFSVCNLEVQLEHSKTPKMQFFTFSRFTFLQKAPSFKCYHGGIKEKERQRRDKQSLFGN